MNYNIRNVPVRWQISTRISLILQHFSLASTLFKIFTFEIFDLEEVGQVTEYNTGNIVGRFQMSKSINVIFTYFIFVKI